MPVWWDNGDNARRISDLGAGVMVEKGATAEEMYDAVVEVRDDSKYRKSVSRLADLMDAEEKSPLERATSLVEFVARTEGADHLKIASRHLSPWQYIFADAILMLLLLPSLLLALIFAVKKFAVRGSASTSELPAAKKEA